MKLRFAKLIVHACMLAAAFAAHAQADATYPNRPVRVIVGYTAGGASDIIGRLIARELQAMNGQPFVVDNKPGVGGMLGLSLAAKAPPDGYTLGVAVSGMLVTGPHLTKTKLYDPLKDFEPISLVAKAPMVLLAAPDFKYNTVSTLVKEAKARPGELQFASGAQAFELAMQLFNSKAGVKIGSVPYPGGSQAALDVIAGRVPVMVDTIGAQQAMIKSGKLKAVAVLDSKRSVVLPDVPTVAEAGVPGYEALGWTSIVAPKGTPEPIVRKLNEQLRKIMAMPEVSDKLTQLGFEPTSGSPRDLDRLIQTDYAKWGAVVKEAGIEPQ